ncbi:hypothetical protein BJX76DRAFT_68364 [Aspergillus varians]
METELYSSINWALNTDPAESLFPWETASAWPGQTDTRTDAQLDLLLSASSYPMPEPPLFPDQQDLEQNHPVHLYGGLFINEDDTASEQAGTQPADNDNPAAAPARSQPNTRVSKPAPPVKKRGRPRKLIEEAGVNAEERRRAQVRMAQRAYRSRKDANVSSLKERINQLEVAVKQMSTSVISLGDDIVRSGALDSHPDLLRPLGNTVQACLALPMIPHGDFSDSQVELQDSSPGQNRRVGYPSPSSSESADTMDISEFADRLHVTCSYQAYLVCANPAIPERRLESRFLILLSVMPRPFVAEFFKDWLLARAGHKTLDHWSHIPFFRIGGAGTHYPASGDPHFPFPNRQGSAAIQEGLSRFTPDVQDELEDEWFDLGDLQGYLHERQVVFPASARSISPVGGRQKDPSATSVSHLMQQLIKGAICLGRTPGFRRRDVEMAVDEFLASQNGALF